MDVILSEAEGSPVDASSMLFALKYILLDSTGDPFDSLRSLPMTLQPNAGHSERALRVEESPVDVANLLTGADFGLLTSMGDPSTPLHSAQGDRRWGGVVIACFIAVDGVRGSG
jgi:hypothetical protein